MKKIRNKRQLSQQNSNSDNKAKELTTKNGDFICFYTNNNI